LSSSPFHYERFSRLYSLPNIMPVIKFIDNKARGRYNVFCCGTLKNEMPCTSRNREKDEIKIYLNRWINFCSWQAEMASLNEPRTFGIHKIRSISWITQYLLASQKLLYFMEIVGIILNMSFILLICIFNLLKDNIKKGFVKHVVRVSCGIQGWVLCEVICFERPSWSTSGVLRNLVCPIASNLCCSVPG
jgi:hypothetical protein